ncbi:hypothetical protein ERX46_11845 [Brumimicrobium glaciale]|uniref:Uncharacterized protein n=1 Tax=Brumimicrobium glaciale TaxID=200475 RepID=A0A4Q4KHR2_9FLAO|nr:hypothetical protein [Brumimicrobium glaciale]RYM32751.1 hypothetical protein ERX46_11845 [Brumimicrobium glaciale]
MKKLLLTLFSITFSLMLFAQENLYVDSKIKVQFSVEEHTDAVNDIFYEYYSFEITNVSQNQVSFTPVFNYTNEKGEQKNTANGDDNNVIQLTPGETIKGGLIDYKNLTLFKQFLVGNSGKRAANTTTSIQSTTINYQ